MIEISHDLIRDNLKKFINDNDNEPAPNTPEGVAVTALMIASKLLRENKKLVKKTEKAIFESDMPIESKLVLMFHILAMIECTQPADKDEDEE